MLARRAHVRQEKQWGHARELVKAGVKRCSVSDNTMDEPMLEERHEHMASGMHQTDRCLDGTWSNGAAENQAVSAPRVLTHARRGNSDVGQQTSKWVSAVATGLVDGMAAWRCVVYGAGMVPECLL